MDSGDHFESYNFEDEAAEKKGKLKVYVIKNMQNHVLTMSFEERTAQMLFARSDWAEHVADRMERYFDVYGAWPQFRVPFTESDDLPAATGENLQFLSVEECVFDECLQGATQFSLDLMLIDEIHFTERGPLFMNGHVIQIDMEPSADTLHNMWNKEL